MEESRTDPSLHSDTNRSIWIGGGVQGVSLVAAYFVGGTFFPYLFLWLSCVMILRGWKPAWFAIHHDAQIIAGTKYYREESTKAWMVAWGLSLVLAWGSSWLHLAIVPERPDLAKTIIDGVKGLLDRKQTAVPSDQKPSTPVSNQSGPGLPSLPLDRRGFLQLKEIIDDGTPLASDNKAHRLDVTFANKGGVPIHDVSAHGSLWLLRGSEDERNVDLRHKFGEFLKDSEANRKASITPFLGVEQVVWNTTYLEINNRDLSEILTGQAFIYLVGHGWWREDPEGLNLCLGMQKPPAGTTHILFKDAVWHGCDPRNK